MAAVGLKNVPFAVPLLNGIITVAVTVGRVVFGEMGCVGGTNVVTTLDAAGTEDATVEATELAAVGTVLDISNGDMV